MLTATVVDDLPDWAIPGRKVESEWRKKRAAKRARRFVMVGWGELASDMQAVGTDRATRLLMLLYLYARLQRVKTGGGWIELALHDLATVGLADKNFHRVVEQLETAGRIEVRRRPGKRPLVKLVTPRA